MSDEYESCTGPGKCCSREVRDRRIRGLRSNVRYSVLRPCASLHVGVELRHFVREGDVVYAAGSEGEALIVLRVQH